LKIFSFAFWHLVADKKSVVQRHLHTHVHCSTVHSSQATEIAKIPTMDEWIKKMWYLYTMEFYAATKNNETLSLTGKWMKLENIILSEFSQTQKSKSCMFSLICGIQTQYKCSNVMKHWTH
jgi:CDP-diacylglycerol pyrophosphatase